jgi:LPXTG-site transpeptidase (sortase) family protein
MDESNLSTSAERIRATIRAQFYGNTRIPHVLETTHPLETPATLIKRKPTSKWLLLGVASASFCFILCLYFVMSLNKKKTTEEPLSNIVENQELRNETEKKRVVLPVRLRIPTLQVDTFIEQVDITPQGAMDTPKDPANVGWFDVGPSPGEKGNAVITGHFNTQDGQPGVFSGLSQLKSGDKLYVDDEEEHTHIFVVRENHSYKEGYAEEVFSNNYGVHLNLITCEGIWNKTKKSYSERLVVFADLVE